MITEHDVKELRELANIRSYAIAQVVIARVFAGIYKTQSEATAELKRVFDIKDEK